VLPEIVATLDALPELVVILESGGSIVAANHRFARIFDGSPEGLIGRSLFDLLETHPEHAREYLRRCAGTLQPMPGALVFRQSDGAPLECQCSGAALPR
jgi:PAS domain S-box-containing protein